MYLKRNNNQWLSPQIAPFSGQFTDMSPCFLTDGKKVYFASKRPLRGGADFNFWMIEKTGNKWSKAVEIESTVNSEYNEGNPTIATNSNLYFQYFTDNGLKSDLYFSKYVDGRYVKPEKLLDGINTQHNDAGPFIAPDESFLMFHSDWPGGYGYMDLYISFKENDGRWGDVKNLGEEIPI